MGAVQWAFRVLVSAAIVAGLSGCGLRPFHYPNPPTPKASAARPGDNLAPIALDRIVVDIPRGTVIGEFANDGGLVGDCLVRVWEAAWPGGTTLADDRDLRTLFAQTMNAQNYNATGDSSELFSDVSADRKDPTYLIGGRIDAINLGLCDETRGGTIFTGTQRGHGTVDVTWQVFSALERKVVYETKTTGYGELRSGMPDGIEAITMIAVESAMKNLAADPGFHQLLTNEAGSATAPAPLSASELRIRAVEPFAGGIASNVARIERSVVTVVTGGGHGSGFFIAPTLVLTNHHVAGGSKRVKLQFVDGREVYATVLRSHPDRDVALLEVETGSYEALPIRGARAGITEEVYAVGSPLDESLVGTVTRGIVSQIKPDERNLEFIQADVNIQHGSSGGPLLDRDGNVLGISDMALTDQADHSMGINFFIPIGDALKKLNIVLN